MEREKRRRRRKRRERVNSPKKDSGSKGGRRRKENSKSREGKRCGSGYYMRKSTLLNQSTLGKRGKEKTWAERAMVEATRRREAAKMMEADVHSSGACNERPRRDDGD